MTTPHATLPSLDLLQVFVRVAELSSFSRAAEDLGLPKASISGAVQRLEAQLGTRLLHRTTRRVELSQDGQACYERAKDLLADVEDLQALFQQRAPQALRGRLRIDLPVGIARRLVIPRLPEFLDRHPLLTLEVSSTDRRVDLVREGFDCVLRVGALADSGLVARPLGELPQMNCASPDYVRRFGLPRSLDDLAGHRMVHYAGTLGARPMGWEHGRGDTLRTLTLEGSITVNNSDAYEAACLAGLGIIQAPAIGMRPHVEAGRLVELLPEHTAPPMPVSLVYAHRRQLPLRVQAVMGWIAEILKPHLAPVGGAAVGAAGDGIGKLVDHQPGGFAPAGLPEAPSGRRPKAAPKAPPSR
jgi:DNA-binding transcriptional LysR family regulator